MVRRSLNMTNVILYNEPLIGKNVEIQDFVVIGKDGSRKALRKTKIGENSKICTGAIIYNGVKIGKNCLIGDQARIRENCVIGDKTVIGSHACIENNAEIGKYVLIETQAHITAYIKIEDYVFISAHVTTTNDKFMAHPLKFRKGLKGKVELCGGVIKRGARIGAGAEILPGLTIGEEAKIGAGSVVTKDVPPYTIVYKTPARQIRRVDENELLQIPKNQRKAKPERD